LQTLTLFDRFTESASGCDGSIQRLGEFVWIE
jgi:hypothetical protein